MFLFFDRELIEAGGIGDGTDHAVEVMEPVQEVNAFGVIPREVLRSRNTLGRCIVVVQGYCTVIVLDRIPCGVADGLVVVDINPSALEGSRNITGKPS